MAERNNEPGYGRASCSRGNGRNKARLNESKRLMAMGALPIMPLILFRPFADLHQTFLLWLRCTCVSETRKRYQSVRQSVSQSIINAILAIDQSIHLSLSLLFPLLINRPIDEERTIMTIYAT